MAGAGRHRRCMPALGRRHAAQSCHLPSLAAAPALKTPFTSSSRKSSASWQRWRQRRSRWRRRAPSRSPRRRRCLAPRAAQAARFPALETRLPCRCCRRRRRRLIRSPSSSSRMASGEGGRRRRAAPRRPPRRRPTAARGRGKGSARPTTSGGAAARRSSRRQSTPAPGQHSYRCPARGGTARRRPLPARRGRPLGQARRGPGGLLAAPRRRSSSNCRRMGSHRPAACHPSGQGLGVRRQAGEAGRPSPAGAAAGAAGGDRRRRRHCRQPASDNAGLAACLLLLFACCSALHRCGAVIHGTTPSGVARCVWALGGLHRGMEQGGGIQEGEAWGDRSRIQIQKLGVGLPEGGGGCLGHSSSFFLVVFLRSELCPKEERARRGPHRRRDNAGTTTTAALRCCCSQLGRSTLLLLQLHRCTCGPPMCRQQRSRPRCWHRSAGAEGSVAGCPHHARPKRYRCARHRLGGMR